MKYDEVEIDEVKYEEVEIDEVKADDHEESEAVKLIAKKKAAKAALILTIDVNYYSAGTAALAVSISNNSTSKIRVAPGGIEPAPCSP